MGRYVDVYRYIERRGGRELTEGPRERHRGSNIRETEQSDKETKRQRMTD